MRFFGISGTKMVSARVALYGGLIFLITFFLAVPWASSAQTTNAELSSIVKQIQEAIVRGATEEEIALLQKKLVNAQISQSVEVKITPEYPGPNEDVTVEIISYQTDLQRAKITWESGGKTLATGFGVIKQTIRTKNAGVRTTLAISISTHEGLFISKNVSVTPIELEMHWETSSYTPPFYRGKALPSPKSEIKIVALPNFIDTNKNTVSEKNLVYIWRAQNGTILNQGYGKSYAYTPAPDGIGFERPIDVDVSSLNNTLRSKKRFYIKAFSPLVQFYEDNPLLGVMYDHALLQEVVLLNDEIALRGEPFFFSQTHKNTGKLVYQWAQNGKSIANESGSSIILRKESPSEGSSRINLSVKNSENIFENASRSFMMRYSKTESLF
ncbi:MAG: hypothetical protein Q7S11_03495 [bacterium]|nr:hypothetical protein [bacterium]